MSAPRTDVASSIKVENRLDSKTRSSKITSGTSSDLIASPLRLHPLRSRSGKQPSASPHRPSKQTPLKKQAKSERKLPSTSTSPRHIEGAESSMEEGETSAEESSDEVSTKPVKPVIAPRSPAAKAIECNRMQ
ncbi:hypothetical protein TNCV_1717511 [Trichonephila clavipes]|nr:hypothetical protein TNCV_1717511 [Trichonephila clavipes]